VKNEFTAIIERGDDGWWVASCPEVPGANGQGRTIEAVKEDLVAAIELMLELRREMGLKEASPGALQDTVVVG
jgi:predicted RNase H-like HicB family nuclease